MDFIRAQLERIQQQLAGLSATQKMLTVALVAIMVITVLWWGKYASEAEMVPLLRQTMSDAEIGRMQDSLESKGIHTEISGGTLLVHPDQRLAAMSALTFAKALPHITDDGFKDLVSQINPFLSESQVGKFWTQYKQQLLGKVIEGMKGVASAQVMIDSTGRRDIGAGDVEPSSSVNITLEEGVADAQKLVDAAAALVAGSQAGLKPSHVSVIVNGVLQKVRDPSSDPLADASEQLHTRQQDELYQENKVRGAYSWITHLAVKVTVTLNTTMVQEQKKTYDAKGVVKAPVKSTEETDETTGPAPSAGGEAGAVPNMGLPPAGPAANAAGPTQNHSKTEAQTEVKIPETVTTSSTPAGATTVAGVTVQVPYRYFVGEYKEINPNAKDPTEKDVQPLISNELGSMKTAVATLLSVPADRISVGTFHEIVDPATSTQPVVASTVGSVSSLVGGHAKEIALGMLAIMSLFMASMMVRKTTPAVVPAVAHTNSLATPSLLSTEPIAGEAAGGDALLDGMELNEEAIKAQHMVDQVSTMVRENPDAAAALVKRWLNRT
jgi:flagellar biosynthesis/type III secretory pathway M-ring protein FliF/YscJ